VADSARREALVVAKGTQEEARHLAAYARAQNHRDHYRSNARSEGW